MGRMMHYPHFIPFRPLFYHQAKLKGPWACEQTASTINATPPRREPTAPRPSLRLLIIPICSRLFESIHCSRVVEAHHRGTTTSLKACRSP